MGLPNSLTLYAAAGALIVGVSTGWTVRDWKCDAAIAQAMVDAEKARKKIETERDRVSQEYEAFRAGLPAQTIETRNTIREIYRDKVVRPDCAADPAFGRLLQAAADRASSAATGEPVPAVRPSPKGP